MLFLIVLPDYVDYETGDFAPILGIRICDVWLLKIGMCMIFSNFLDFKP